VEKEGSSSSDVDAERSGVRCRVASPNWRAHEGEQEREMGGGSAQCRVQEGKRERERERAPGAAVGSTDHRVGMAPGGAVGGDSACSQQRRAGKQGRVAGRG
jgi:hypothetical protein